MAWICAVLVLAITSLSAYIRLSKAGLGCEPWPQCYGQQLRAQLQGEPPLQADAATADARLAHRVIASSALLLVLVMVMAAVASRPVLWPQGRLALGLLGWRFSGGARALDGPCPHPAVTLGNLLGLCHVRGERADGADRPSGFHPGGPPPRLARWAWLGAALCWRRWRWVGWSARDRPA